MALQRAFTFGVERVSHPHDSAKGLRDCAPLPRILRPIEPTGPKRGPLRQDASYVCALFLLVVWIVLVGAELLGELREHGLALLIGRVLAGLL